MVKSHSNTHSTGVHQDCYMRTKLCTDDWSHNKKKPNDALRGLQLRYIPLRSPHISHTDTHTETYGHTDTHRHTQKHTDTETCCDIDTCVPHIETARWVCRCSWNTLHARGMRPSECLAPVPTRTPPRNHWCTPCLWVRAGPTRSTTRTTCPS